MLAYLLCFVLGLAFPSIVRKVARRETRSNELYDLADTLSLNLVGGSESTLWHNMGYWVKAGEESFAEAASELCRRVAKAADRGKRICEVGYGSGDSTLLFASEFSPETYVGFTPIESQQATAARRAVRAGLDPVRFDIRRGDAAVDLGSLKTSSIDAVVAIDCAFHFNTKQDFFRSATKVLAPSGRIALADLVLPSSPLTFLDTFLLRLLCLAARIPFSNLKTPSEYRASLVSAGFDASSIEMTDISTEVWAGFLGFVERRNREFGGPSGAVLGSSWKGLDLYSKVVKWYSGEGGGRPRLRFYLVSAAIGQDEARTASGKVY
ncbi:hypothetical protein JCM10212_000930 [Sporobolomyces blumeae]